MQDKPSAIDYEIAHTTMGRIRIRIPKIKESPVYTSELEKLIVNHPGITDVRINPTAISVVVSYKPKVISDEAIVPQLHNYIQQAGGVDPATVPFPLPSKTETETSLETEVESSGNSETSLETEVESSGNSETSLETEVESSGNSETSLETETENSGNIETPLETETENSGNIETPLETETENSGNIETPLETETENSRNSETSNLTEEAPQTKGEREEISQANASEVLAEDAVISKESTSESQSSEVSITTIESKEESKEEVEKEAEKKSILRLNQKTLAKRLHISTTSLRQARSQPDFAAWSSAKDPEGKAWKYKTESGFYEEILDE
ncbi:HMA2 domain-containing protein [Floridanema aerugineum]|uniref:HMA2 domain-containing protein n=1 Tax=Floridaenema aerugineum BLCC-F46 TaxID=3153654 RepID=A0ABV4X0N9_9CYAN